MIGGHGMNIRALGIAAAAALVLAFVARAAETAPAIAPLPLGNGANTGFADDKAGDRQGGWIDQGGNDLHLIKPGKLKAAGIPFEILDEAAAAGKSCIVLGGPTRDRFPVKAQVPFAVEAAGTNLYLLHAAAWCPPAKDLKMVGVIFVDYADGSTSEHHVRFGRDVGDWTRPDGYKNAARGWTVYNGNTQISLFVSRFTLKQRALKAVRFESKEETAWMIVAASVGEEAKLAPIKPDLKLDKRYVAPELGQPLVQPSGDAAPKNIILLIGDGMGPGAIRLTSLYQHKEDGRLVFQQLPVASSCTTHSADKPVTDSAAAATALACGRKTNNAMIGFTPDGARLTSLTEVASREGRAVGLITSDAITGATPGGFYAHVDSRGSYQGVADDAALCGFDLLIGNANGKGWFLPKELKGQRTDARNLLEEMGAKGYVAVEKTAEFAAAPAEKRVVGFLDKESLEPEQSLAALTDIALARLSKNDKGFFLMVECTITDGGGHGNKPELTVRGTLQVDWAAKRAVEFARSRGDTLVLVTADHETGGLTAGFTNTPPGKLVMDYATTSHTEAPVKVFAYGPGAQRFQRPLDNTDIAKTFCTLWQITLPEPVPQPKAAEPAKAK